MEIDYMLCIICQQQTKEQLKCPLLTPDPHTDKTSAYQSFLTNVEQFREIDQLPTELKFGRDHKVDDLINNSALWHKSCHLKFNKDKLARARKRKSNSCVTEPFRHIVKRRSITMTHQCFFCEKNADEGDLHQVSTYDMDVSLRSIINELQDTQLIAKIVGGDLIAMDAKYHLKCLTNLRNRYRSHTRQLHQATVNIDGAMSESRAFIELTSFIEMSVKAGTLLFRLSELHSLYIKRLEELGISKTINKTRLKEQLIEHFGDAQVQYIDGKNIVLVFTEGIKGIIKDAVEQRDYSEDALILARAAKIIRKDVFHHENFKFTGQFPPHCQDNALPSSLKLLVSMILNGPSLKDQEIHESQVCLTIGQTIIYNIKKKKPNSPVKIRHTLDREPPLPIYIGINIHALTRSKKLIQQLHQMGICISYDRVMQLEDWLATSVCERFKTDGAVAPTILRKGIFTVGALDNLDHDPSSTTSKTSFHGTGISLFQFPTEKEPGVIRNSVLIPPSSLNTQSLPDSYAFVPAVSLKTNSVSVSQTSVQHIKSVLPDAKRAEYDWIEHGLKLLNNTELDKANSLTWSAYHASIKQDVVVESPAVCALLPLFYEKSASPAMIKHGMDIQKQATEFLNPGQIPVTTFDQPLFTLAKYVQWKWPDTHGEKVHVVMMGGLHIEMALWNTVGDLLHGSGWTTALTEAEIASSGIADSFLKASHLTRTRHAHQVTLLTLQNLMQEAFNQRSSTVIDNDSFNNWHEQMSKNSPTFKFWDMIMEYEILVLIFVRAHRDRDFTLYINVLEELVHLFFILDHVNYARWLPVHIRDMKSLPKQIKDEFESRHHWVITKSAHRYSAIPIDQAHEQENKIVKGSGGAVGLTENPAAFRRWMTSGPELARLVKQFENEYIYDDDPENPSNFEHHEQGLAAQNTFQRQVNSLSEIIKKMGNPFMDDFRELITLDSRNCASESVVNTIRTLKDIGTKQYQNYVTTVLVNRTRSIHNPISKNSLPLFSTKVKAISKDGKKLKILENNVALFGQLYISLQNRDGDINEFFAHEVQSYPPSLSDFGKLYLPGTKSQLLSCIVEPKQIEPPTSFDCKILDGAVIVHSLPITTATTFHEYADNVFIPHMIRQLQTTKRLDIVWDTYQPESLKEATREKRGKGLRRKVSGNTKLPTNWNDFLRDPINKIELFDFLSSKVSGFSYPEGSSVYITARENVKCIGTEYKMSSCNQEEADTRIVVHLRHALENGATIVQVRTVDTDIIVVLNGVFYDLLKINAKLNLWVAYGVGKNFSHYSINAICARLGEPKSRSLPMFHAFSGCDTTSAFRGKGKKSFWQSWHAYDEVTNAFLHLATHPFENVDLNSETFKMIERLVIIVYDKTSNLTNINSACMELFSQKSQSVEKIPPTQNALLQHTNRAVYQAGVWATSMLTQQSLPSPTEFGWKKIPESWEPVWTTLPEASRACREFIKCCCKGNCVVCKCSKANLPCTSLCHCKC